jgi:hypothetical protein
LLKEGCNRKLKLIRAAAAGAVRLELERGRQLVVWADYQTAEMLRERDVLPNQGDLPRRWTVIDARYVDAGVEGVVTVACAAHFTIEMVLDPAPEVGPSASS